MKMEKCKSMCRTPFAVLINTRQMTIFDLRRSNLLTTSVKEGNSDANTTRHKMTNYTAEKCKHAISVYSEDTGLLSKKTVSFIQ